MTKLAMVGAAMSAVSAMSMVGDIRGDMYGTKHHNTVTPKHIKKDANRAKAKAAKKSRQKQRNK